MPSHTAASALIKLYYLGGLPWNCTLWQEITDIKHGLFPTDDHHLPKGWTRSDADDIHSYFEQYNQLDTEDNKVKFAVAHQGGALIPGRKKWNDFVSKFWEKWNIHGRITEGLRKHGIHPITILVQEGSLDSWPNPEMYVPMALDTIGMLVFGGEAFDDAEILSYAVRKCLSIFVQRSWSRVRRQVRKDRARLSDIEKSALNAFEGMLFAQWLATPLANISTDLGKGRVTKAKVIRTIRAVARWKDITDIYGTKDNLLKAADMLAEVNRVMEGLGVSIPKSKPSTGKRLCFPL
jgi:TATA-binding protein-associated factor